MQFNSYSLPQRHEIKSNAEIIGEFLLSLRQGANFPTIAEAYGFYQILSPFLSRNSVFLLINATHAANVFIFRYSGKK